MKRLAMIVTTVAAVAGACGQQTTNGETGAGAARAGEVATAPRDYCTVVAEVNELSLTSVSVDVNSSMGDAEIAERTARFREQIDASIERGNRLFAELEDAAPEELKADVRLVASDAISRGEKLRDSGGDPIAMMQAMWPSTQNAELIAALGRIDTHTRAACSTPFGPAQFEPSSPYPRPSFHGFTHSSHRTTSP